MPVIQSEIDVHGEGFAQNRKAMLAAIASFRDVERKVLDKANEAKAKFERRGLRSDVQRRSVCRPEELKDKE